MSDAPYRPPPTQQPTQQPIQQPNPFTSGYVTIQVPDVTDVDQFPSLCGDMGKPSEWAHDGGHVGRREDVNGINVDGVPLQPGWLYIDGFDRTVRTLYGGPSSDLRYDDLWPLTRMIDKEVAARHKQQRQDLEELEDAIGDIAPLVLQLATQEREDWLIQDTLDTDRYSSDGESDGAADAADDGYL